MIRAIHQFLRQGLALLFAVTAFQANINAQDAEIRGRITDAVDGNPLAGVNIVLDSLNGAASDAQGQYSLKVKPGNYVLNYRFVGYEPYRVSVTLKENEILTKDIQLSQSAVLLNTAVISASRYEQRLSDVTVSMEIIKPTFIEKQNANQLDEALRLIPGVDVIDGQANIRGGSGYSYGAGSRVILLVDELPMLTGDVNEVKWNFIPVENIGQVEVIKGASSALYGSSALNGVINVRTTAPGDKPETTVSLSQGVYTRPARKELSWWWDGVPLYSSVKASHMRKAGPVDLTFGLNGFGDQGYRTDNYQYYGRASAGIRYNPPGVKGLSAGLRASIQWQESSDFLLWTDADSGAFVQNPVSVSPTNGIRFNVDPYVVYFDDKKGEHALRTRYYKVQNTFDEDPDKDNGSGYYFGEYQYQKQFRYNIHLAAGLAASYTDGRSNLYGNHTGSSFAAFAQFDKRFFDRLSASLGLRWERNRLDAEKAEAKPVVRAGISYKAAGSTFLRASFGQGYRFPSMAEKYTATSLGSLNIFPNPDLTSETGWSAEIGIRQGFQLGSLSGSLDVAGFWTEYQDLMEFTFGLYLPDSNTLPTLDHIGFKSVNIGVARIAGIDISLNGQVKTGAFLLSYFAGYTYLDPIDHSVDSIENEILKYRYRHSAKGNAEVEYRHYNLGITINYQSFTERIDEAFETVILGQEFFPGLKDYREANNKGAVVIDIRTGYQLTASSEISLIIKNIFNKEYMGRPGDIQPPRTIALQYVLKI